MSSAAHDERAREAQGRNAGIVSRVVANAVDGVVVTLIFVGMLAGVGLVRFLLGHKELALPKPPVGVTVALMWVLLTAYLALGWGGDGRTLGKRVMGLRVVSRGGGRLRPVQAVGRAALCVSFEVIVLAWVVVSRHNYGLHDLVFRTHVVYDWPRGVS
ncbi:MAG: RDD family protein [Acidimicrobiia bacterium]